MLLKMSLFHSVFMQSGVPLRVCMYLFICTRRLYASVSQWTSGRVHVLAIVHSAAVDTMGCMHLFKSQFSPDARPGMGLQGHTQHYFSFLRELPASVRIALIISTFEGLFMCF